MTVPFGWRSATAPREPRKRHLFIRDDGKLLYIDNGVSVSPLMDRRHRYARARVNGRDVLQHSAVESAR